MHANVVTWPILLTVYITKLVFEKIWVHSDSSRQSMMQDKSSVRQIHCLSIHTFLAPPKPLVAALRRHGEYMNQAWNEWHSNFIKWGILHCRIISMTIPFESTASRITKGAQWKAAGYYGIINTVNICHRSQNRKWKNTQKAELPGTICNHRTKNAKIVFGM